MSFTPRFHLRDGVFSETTWFTCSYSLGPANKHLAKCLMFTCRRDLVVVDRVLLGHFATGPGHRFSGDPNPLGTEDGKLVKHVQEYPSTNWNIKDGI